MDLLNLIGRTHELFGSDIKTMIFFQSEISNSSFLVELQEL